MVLFKSLVDQLGLCELTAHSEDTVGQRRLTTFLRAELRDGPKTTQVCVGTEASRELE